MQRWIDVLHIVEHMALRDEEILPSVVVEIFQPNAPAGAPTRQRTKASFEAAIAKRPAAVVVIHTVDFSGQLGHDHIGSAIVVVVLKDDTHSRKPPAILGKRGSGFEPDLRECP